MEKLLFHNAQLPEAERALFGLPGGCAYCHVPKAPQAAQPAGELPDYLPTNIRARWMPHARFRHDSHRMLVCTECHNARESSATADVLMPRVGLCAACHNARVGARSDCAECHRYHQRERGYDPDKDWTIREAVGHR
jgi:predicted CXXCH cytochrome family protein